MTKQLIAFIVGVFISSAWWSITVLPKSTGQEPWFFVQVVPTLAFLVIAGFWTHGNLDK